LRLRYGVPVCQHIPADPVDKRVVQAFFEALSGAELDLYDQALQEQNASCEKMRRAQMQQLERLRYDAALSERQYRRVDPLCGLPGYVASGFYPQHTASIRFIQTPHNSMH
jgi:hypothetical protein